MNSTIKESTLKIISRNLQSELPPLEKELILSSDSLPKKDISSPHDNDTLDHEEAQFPPVSPTTTGQMTYPEGGLRAWLVVLGSFCGILASFGFMNTSKSQRLLHCASQAS